MKAFQRARKPEEKEVRRAAILAAARQIAGEVGPMELGLNEIGRRSGVSKPNIYRYFESREHILLHLLVAEMEGVLADLEARLGRRPLKRSTVAARFVAAWLGRPLLCQLLGMVTSILEHNLSVDAIAESKARMVDLSMGAAAAMVRVMPWLDPLDAAWAVQAIALYVAGLWPAAHPSQAAVEVLSRPEFASFKPVAERDLTRFVEVLLAGLDAMKA
jgi:AcrR family transcriptional regulator